MPSNPFAAALPISRGHFLRGALGAGVVVGLGGMTAEAAAQGVSDVSGNESKAPTEATRRANAAFRQALPFGDAQDFEDAKRGLIATLPEPVVIKGSGPWPIWDLSAYSFISRDTADDAPDSVNPSLWRTAKLNAIHGLFEVTDGIWQARGYDASTMTIIRSDNGYVVVDPFTCIEAARTVWQQLVVPRLGNRPVKAVIYTHSHIDHYGGAQGIIEQASVDAGAVKVIAPEGFVEAAVGENVIAGVAMSRRSAYQYGGFLPRGVNGQVDSGLTKTVPLGTMGLILPTDYVTTTGQTLVVDGVELKVIMAPESEAPAEFMFYLPKHRVFCAAEDANHTLHNLYTLRGAKVRDGLRWSKYLQQALDMFGADMQAVISSHHWPVWGNARAVDFLKAQRDLYRFLHDQTMRLANSGYTPLEIGDAIRLPAGLEKRWACRGYYGTVYHDAMAQYNLRLGAFDGVPANLHRRTPVELGQRYVELAGGADALLAKARKSYGDGDYRWVAELVNHLVFADPANVAARHLLADAYEQLGYQSEAGTWRNFYLTGALELRQGVNRLAAGSSASPETIRAMPLDLIFDYLGVRLNAERVGDKTVEINYELTDTREKYVLGVENGAIHYSKGRTDPNADVSVRTTRAALNDIFTGASTMQKQVVAGKLEITGDARKMAEFFTWLDDFDVWFNIVTP